MFGGFKKARNFVSAIQKQQQVLYLLKQAIQIQIIGKMGEWLKPAVC